MPLKSPERYARPLSFPFPFQKTLLNIIIQHELKSLNRLMRRRQAG